MLGEGPPGSVISQVSEAAACCDGRVASASVKTTAGGSIKRSSFRDGVL